MASPMDKVIADADKEVLVEMVRLAQKQHLKGVQGDWKDFLNRRDKKLGSGLSDPAKRSTEILLAFLKTFTKEEDIKLFSNMVSRQSDIKKSAKESPDQESPQQMLVRQTVEHPNYIQHYSFPSHDEGWIITPQGKTSKASKSITMIAIDCEMVLCEDGTEAVVKVCAVDHDLKVRLDKLVNPYKVVADYRTSITDMSAKDLEGVTCSLFDIQKSLKKLLLHGTILVGHSLHNDLRALKIDHQRVIDTSYIFKIKDVPAAYSPSLNNLCKSVLGFGVRKEGESHNCMDDARAAMKLVLAKLEKGFNEPIAVTSKNVPIFDLSKLLLHKIPVDIPYEELLKLFSSDYNFDIQSDVRIRGQSYSTFAVFKDSREADEAFKAIEGQESKDTGGRNQKRVLLKINTGQTVAFYVRKMAPDSLLKNGALPKKRPAHDETDGTKRQKLSLHQCDESHETNKCDQAQDANECDKPQETNHAQEIDNLLQELCHKEDEIHSLKKSLTAKDKEILSLQKILAALTRKHGL